MRLTLTAITVSLSYRLCNLAYIRLTVWMKDLLNHTQNVISKFDNQYKITLLREYLPANSKFGL